jgi:hypothetical protein
LGLIAIVLLVLWAITCLYSPLAEYKPTAMVGLRVAILLAVFWLAWPDLVRQPRWVWLALPIGLLVVIFARGVLILALPALSGALAVFLVYRRLRRPT